MDNIEQKSSNNSAKDKTNQEIPVEQSKQNERIISKRKVKQECI